MAYSPTMMRWMTQDPLGYIDGMDDFVFVRENPVNSVDPSGLATLIVHDPNGSGAGGHVAIVITNTSDLPGGTSAYPSGQAVLSWEPDHWPNAAGNWGNIGIYDYDQYLKNYSPKVPIHVYPINDTPDSAIKNSAKKDPTWGLNRRDNCADQAMKALGDANPNGNLVNKGAGAGSPKDLLDLLGPAPTDTKGTGGPSSGSSSSGSSNSSGSSGSSRSSSNTTSSR